MPRTKSKITKKTKTTKTTKKTTTKSKTTTKKPKKSQVIELIPNKAPIDTLIPSQSGISPAQELIVQTASTKSNILRVPVEQVEGKILKTITYNQYFYPTDISANTCEDLLAIDLLKLSDNSKSKIEVAPEQLLFTEDDEPIQAQDLLDGSVIKGVFSNFKVISVHIFKNKYDRVYNFKNSTDTVMLANGVLLNLGISVDGTD